MSTEHDALRGTLSNSICNASLYPKRAQPYILGGDMSDVLDRTADNLLAAGYRKVETVSPTAAEEAMRRYNGDVDSETGACVDDWGYSEGERRAFVAGALFESHSKPRTITTIAELDALPVGAIVLDSTDSDWRKVDYSSSTAGTDHRWATAGWEVAYSAKEVELPATVLHTPEGGN